jgi:hypothetical protein
VERVVEMAVESSAAKEEEMRVAAAGAATVERSAKCSR